jgi:hypothetical protein
VLDSYGSETSLFRDNALTRGEAQGVKQAVEVRGRFSLLDNRFFGFDEPGSAALALYPDRFGKPLRNLYRGNLFQRCAAVMAESEQGLWNAALSGGNQFVDCGAMLGTKAP